MIVILSLLLLFVLLWLAVFAVMYAAKLLRGENRRRMLMSCSRTLCDGPGRVGISALCADIGSADRICNLLAVEYEHYELVVVIDSVSSPDLLHELIERYALVAVDYAAPESGSLPGVARLYRSRRRRFRRLAVADVMSVSPEADLDAALDIAVYDYVMPVLSDVELLPYAVERLAAEICISPQRPHEVHAEAGAELAVYLRDDVVAAGGFAYCRRYYCRRRCRVSVYECLAVDRAGYRAGAVFGIVSAAVLLVAACVISRIASNPWPLFGTVTALLVVAASVLPVAGCLAPNLHGRAAYVCALRCFCEKILLKISR